MTSQPGGAPRPERPGAAHFTEPLRQPAAFVLLGANGLFLVLGIVDLFAIFDNWATNFLNRTDGAGFGTFVGLVSIGFPLLAVLLATHVRPPVSQARLITVGALVEYGVSLLFGALCLLVGFLHGLTRSVASLGLGPQREALETLLIRGAWLGLLGVAGLAVFTLFQGLYAVPKPTPQPYTGGYAPGYAPPAGYRPPGDDPNRTQIIPPPTQP